MNNFTDLFEQMHTLSGYVARQQNPFTGYSLPSPNIGFNSSLFPAPPLSPGQLSRSTDSGASSGA